MKLASHAAAIFDFEKGGSLGRVGFEVNMAADTQNPNTPCHQENTCALDFKNDVEAW